jgi:hypothetical protein
MNVMESSQATQNLQQATTAAGWSSQDLWLAACAIGGNTSLGDVTRIVSGSLAPTMTTYRHLASALNDNLIGTLTLRLPAWD